MSNKILAALLAASALSFTSAAMAGASNSYSTGDSVTLTSTGLTKSNIRNARAEVLHRGYVGESSQLDGRNEAGNTVGPYYCGNDNFGGSEDGCALLKRR